MDNISTVVSDPGDNVTLVTEMAVRNAIGNVDLNSAYESGNTITVTDTDGDVIIDLTETTDFVIEDNNVAFFTATDGGSLDVQTSALGTISLDADGASNFTTATGSMSIVGDAGVNITSTTSAGVFIDANTLGNVEINAAGGTIEVGNDPVNQAINVGTLGDRTITVGNSTGATAIDIVSGTGNVDVSGNLNANSGLDVTTADLTVGGANFVVDQATGATTITNAAAALTVTDGAEIISLNGATGIISTTDGTDAISINGGNSTITLFDGATNSTTATSGSVATTDGTIITGFNLTNMGLFNAPNFVSMSTSGVISSTDGANTVSMDGIGAATISATDGTNTITIDATAGTMVATDGSETVTIDGTAGSLITTGSVTLGNAVGDAVIVNGTATFNNASTTFNVGLDMPDNQSLLLGSTNDFEIVHNAINTVATSNTGDLVIDNTNTTGTTILQLGTDDAATAVEIQNNTGTTLFKMDAAGVLTVSSLGGADGQEFTDIQGPMNENFNN